MRVKRLVASLLLLAALLVTSCRALGPTTSTGRDFFPVGIYCVDDTNDFATVKAAGFNLVTCPATRNHLDAAQANGLKVFAQPNTPAGKIFDDVVASKAIAQFDKHPALWAWYLVDEPDLNLISPDAVSRAADFIRSLHPTKPLALTVMRGNTARTYADSADLVLIDRYPIPWLPLASFGQQVELARLATPPAKPVIAIVQAFDWNTDRASLPDEKDTPLRPPTFAELRCMTYDALARGANGLFYFAFDTGTWKIREQPETWSALQKVVAEVNARRPLFQAEQIWWPKQQQFADPTQRFNAALQSSITSCRLRVLAGDKNFPHGDYLLTVNTTDRAQTWSVSLPPENAIADVPVFDEDRTLLPQAGWVTVEFAPYAVHIFGPLK